MHIQDLFKTVVKGGYCIGCGACASVSGSPIEIRFDEDKKLQPYIKQGATEDNMTASALLVCPFSGKSKNEDEIGEKLYSNIGNKNDKLGYVAATYAGFVKEASFRENGSSGGMGTWIMAELFREGYIDSVIHIHSNIPDDNNPKLFQYTISSNLEDIYAGAKSRYYPVELSAVIKEVKERPGRYAFVGLPCFVKSVRLLMMQDPILKERIVFCMGLVCGHLKSAHFASMWAWQVGIFPDNLMSIDFRTKLQDYGANQYGITAKGLIEGNVTTKVSPPLKELFGADWGWGLFKYKACDYCDDVVAETADVTIGDAWLPQYVKDSEGTNVLIVRSEQINNILNKAKSQNRIHLDNLTQDQVINSQSSGFAHRREGLSYRLSLLEKASLWYPAKRVQPSDKAVDNKTKRKLDLRIILSEKSHEYFKEALAKKSFDLLKIKLMPFIHEYYQLYRMSYVKKIFNRLKRHFL